MPCRSENKIAGTFAQQLGWVFVGPCHPSAHGPPALFTKGGEGRKKEGSFTSIQMLHTHTCAEISYRITDVECIGRAKTLQLNLTGEIG